MSPSIELTLMKSKNVLFGVLLILVFLTKESVSQLDWAYEYDGSQFAFVPKLQSKSWSEARNDCATEGGDLVVVTSSKMNDYLTLIAGNIATWLGGKKDSMDVWTWVDGTVISEFFWAPSEPNNAGGTEACLRFNRKNADPGLWNDDTCTGKSAYICQRPIPPSTSTILQPTSTSSSHLLTTAENPFSSKATTPSSTTTTTTTTIAPAYQLKFQNGKVFKNAFKTSNQLFKIKDTSLTKCKIECNLLEKCKGIVIWSKNGSKNCVGLRSLSLPKHSKTDTDAKSYKKKTTQNTSTSKSPATTSTTTTTTKTSTTTKSTSTPSTSTSTKSSTSSTTTSTTTSTTKLTSTSTTSSASTTALTTMQYNFEGYTQAFSAPNQRFQTGFNEANQLFRLTITISQCADKCNFVPQCLGFIYWTNVAGDSFCAGLDYLNLPNFRTTTLVTYNFVKNI